MATHPPALTRTVRGVGLSALAMAAACAPALAQLPQTETASEAILLEPREIAGEAGSNIASYPAAYFAGFNPDTALDMIFRIPGFAFDGGSSGRGFSGTGGNVLIDGSRPPSRSDSLAAVLSRIASSSVERIEVIRGGAEGVDMQGKPIIANVVRKVDAPATGAVGGGTSLNETGWGGGNLQLQFQTPSNGRRFEAGLRLDAGQSDIRSQRDRTAPSGQRLLDAVSTGETSNETLSATGSVETPALGGRFRVNAKVDLASGRSHALEIQSIPVGGRQLSRNDNRSLYAELGGRYTGSVSGYDLELVAFQSLRDSTGSGLDEATTYASSTRAEGSSGETIARSIVRLPGAETSQIEAGGEAVYNWTRSQSFNTFNGSAFALVGDSFEADELRLEGFGTLNWKPTPTLNVELGARYEWSRITAEVGPSASEKTFSYLKPRANLSWSPARGRLYNFLLERRVDQLSFNGFASRVSFEDSVFGVGNESIEPEKSWRMEGRYERQYGGQTTLVAKVTHELTENALGRGVLTLPSSSGGAAQVLEITRNAGRETRSALDLSGDVELDSLGFGGGILSLGAVLRRSETTDPVTQVSRSASGDRPVSLSFSLQQIRDAGRFVWSVYVRDDSDFDVFSPRSFGRQISLPYIGGNLSWKPSPGWTFGAGLNNVLATGRRSWSVFYDAPRNTGAPLYLARSAADGFASLSASLRRTF